MFVFLVSLLGLLYGASCLEEACLSKAQGDCRLYTLIPRHFPGNEEELNNACTNLNQIKECIKNSVRNCTSEDVEDIEEGNRLRQRLKNSQRMLNVTTEICREGSQLHDRTMLDLPCYREAFDTNDRQQRSSEYERNAMNYIRSRLKAKQRERDEEGGLFYGCLIVLFHMNYFLKTFVENCSERAKETAIRLIEIGGSLDDQCPISIRIDIMELLDSLELVTREEIYVKQLLEIDSFL